MLLISVLFVLLFMGMVVLGCMGGGVTKIDEFDKGIGIHSIVL